MFERLFKEQLRGIFFRLWRLVNIDYFFKGKRGAPLYVLLFHRVNDNRDIFYPAVPTAVFEEICDFLSKRFAMIGFSEIDSYSHREKKPAVIMSFDDGSYDIMQHAHPVLKRRGLPYNINIVTESLETGFPPYAVSVYDALNTTRHGAYINEENFSKPVRIAIDRAKPAKTESVFRWLLAGLDEDARRLLAHDIINRLTDGAPPASRVLSKEDIVYLKREGVEIGSHTHSHAILTDLDSAGIDNELRRSKKILEELCGSTIDIIAFPQGKYNNEVVTLSRRAGYRYLLLAGDGTSTEEEIDQHIFERTGLYHATLDENLAKLFGFHRMIGDITRSLCQ